MARPEKIQSDPIPADLRAILLTKLSEQQVAAWATEAVVVEAAREHIISRRKAASLLGLNNYVERHAFFERHGLTNEYTAQMVEMDIKAIETLRAKH
jgi:hypothetical protein